ncbi:MAG: L-threonylcarbamoyladenylate synthase [Myxococcota bacterium]
MRLLPVDPLEPDPAAVAEAAAVLRAGGLVAFPTETVYGLGADARTDAAITRIYEAKQRPGSNPLIVHVPDTGAARALSAGWSSEADRLAEAFWPGPLTLVVPRGPGVSARVSGGLDTVGLRVPAHPVALRLLEEAGLPVAAPSANPYTRISPTTAQHVVDGLGSRVDVVLDGGPTPVGIESTVVSVLGTPRLLRAGMLDAAALREVVPDLEVGPADGPARSPGLAPRHYAPRARLSVGPYTPASGRGHLQRGGTATGPLAIALPADPWGYAAGLYAALHRLDGLGCTEIVADPLPDGEAWQALRDRLERASFPEG